MRGTSRFLFQTRLPARAQSAGSARRWVETLDGPIRGEVLHDIQLLVTELVSNSIRHSGSAEDIDLAVLVKDDAVRVEVRDQGSKRNKPRLEKRGLLATSGRGLTLVSELSDRWGVRESDRIGVWFEIDLPQTG